MNANFYQGGPNMLNNYENRRKNHCITYIPASPGRWVWTPLVAQTQTKAQFGQKVDLK